jgi:hypothetical protein
MKIIGIAALTLILAAPLGIAKADPWKDESGHSRGKGEHSRHWDRERHGDRDWGRRDHPGGRERKVEYDDGRCKVERKWGKNGEYKEERKCRGGPGREFGSRGHHGYGSSQSPHGYAPPHGYGGPFPYGHGYR